MSSFCPYSSGGYPQNAQNFFNYEIKAERQVWGHILSVILILLGIYDIISMATSPLLDMFIVQYGIEIVANVPFITFHLLAIFKSDYLKGKPSFLKLLPLLALPVLCIVIDFIPYVKNEGGAAFILLISFIIHGIRILAYYYMYSADDNSGQWRLIFKPWIHKRPESAAFQYPNQKIPRPVIQEQTFNPLPEYSNTQNPTNV
jgi:hypothetical protein